MQELQKAKEAIELLPIDRDTCEQLVQKTLFILRGFHSPTWDYRVAHENGAQALRALLQGSDAENPVFTCADAGFEELACSLSGDTAVTVIPAWLLDCVPNPVTDPDQQCTTRHRHHVLTTIRRNLGWFGMPLYVPIQELATPFQISNERIDVAQLSMIEQRLLDGLDKLNLHIPEVVRRTLRVAPATAPKIWTDGMSYIAINRKLLLRCEEVEGAMEVFMALIQEYSHKRATWYLRTTDAKYFALFNTLVTDPELIKLACSIPRSAALSSVIRINSHAITTPKNWSLVK